MHAVIRGSSEEGHCVCGGEFFECAAIGMVVDVGAKSLSADPTFWLVGEKNVYKTL